MHPSTNLKSFLTLGLCAWAGVALSATITVNTADNNDFGAGKVNLYRAITNASDGDTIAFNIPGAGPHYLVTPVFGYPVVTANNLVIDGYTQTGASPNTNPLLGTNNAVLKIVLDSRNGEGTSNPGVGFGDSETGVLFLMATNCHVRGLCFLGGGNSGGVNDRAAVNIGNISHDTHISGCWIGVDVDGVTLSPFDRGPTAFGDLVDNLPGWPERPVIGVKPGPHDLAAARAQQNVIVGGWVNIFLEAPYMVIAGNKLNVLPNGMQDVDQFVAPLEAVIETGRMNNAMRIGTDGDGANDAEERNVFGGVFTAGDDNIIEIYSQRGTAAACTNIVVAGNYFGMAVDGVTRFTNVMTLVNNFARRVNNIDFSCQFGSDLNGVSDDIEANVIVEHHPWNSLFPDPFLAAPLRMIALDPNGSLSFRGNKVFGANTLPYTFANLDGGLFLAFTNFHGRYMSSNANIIPVLSSASTAVDIVGSCAPPIAGSYTNLSIDVYVLDPESWTNGQSVVSAQQWFGMTDVATYTNGFANGKALLGTFEDNGPLDRNPAVAAFNFNAAALGIPGGTEITVTANYSADPPGTFRGRTHTSNFSNPVRLAPVFRINSATRAGNLLTITWSGGTGPFTLQKKSPIGGNWGNVASGIAGNSTTQTIEPGEAYYRVVGN